MGFAVFEEGEADAATATGGIEHRFAEVERVVDASERAPDLLGFVCERQRRGRADHAFAVEADRDHRVRRVDVGLQVETLVVRVAFVQVGPVAEHLDAQAGDVVEVAAQGFAGLRDDLQFAHADTCAIQSCRL